MRVGGDDLGGKLGLRHVGGEVGGNRRHRGFDAGSERLGGVGQGWREVGFEGVEDLPGDGGRQAGEERVGVHGGASGWSCVQRVDMDVIYEDFNSYYV